MIFNKNYYGSNIQSVEIPDAKAKHQAKFASSMSSSNKQGSCTILVLSLVSLMVQGLLILESHQLFMDFNPATATSIMERAPMVPGGPREQVQP